MIEALAIVACLVLLIIGACLVVRAPELPMQDRWWEEECAEEEEVVKGSKLPSANVIEHPFLEPKILGRRWWGRLLWRYVLRKRCEYQWSAGGDEFKLVMEPGFECDGTSIPPLASFLTGIERDGPHRPAAFWHDVIYKYAGKLPPGVQFILINDVWEEFHATWTREEADRLFGRVLRELKVGKVDRDIMVSGVRWFGWWPWWRAARKMAKVETKMQMNASRS